MPRDFASTETRAAHREGCSRGGTVAAERRREIKSEGMEFERGWRAGFKAAAALHGAADD